MGRITEWVADGRKHVLTAGDDKNPCFRIHVNTLDSMGFPCYEEVCSISNYGEELPEHKAIFHMIEKLVEERDAAVSARRDEK